MLRKYNTKPSFKVTAATAVTAKPALLRRTESRGAPIGVLLHCRNSDACQTPKTT